MFLGTMSNRVLKKGSILETKRQSAKVPRAASPEMRARVYAFVVAIAKDGISAGIPQTEIARRLSISQMAVSCALFDLEQGGLIRAEFYSRREPSRYYVVPLGAAAPSATTSRNK